MPELHFSIDWPDGTRQTCYSPSTIIREYFTPDTIYEMEEFLARSRAAMTAASDRVRAQYGHACSLAAAQLAQIESAAARYPATSHVKFVSFKD
jgi:uncharacterized repeat protein (TIGR04042 family)